MIARFSLVALIGAASSMLPGTGVSAADFPKAPRPPDERARACTEYGAGFMQLRGSDICLQMSLDILFEEKTNLAKRDFDIQTTRVIDNPVAFYALSPVARATDRISMRVDPRLGFMTATKVGDETLLTNVSFRFSPTLTGASARSDTTTGSDSMSVDQAWMKYRGFTAGRHGSYFDFTPGYTYTGGYASNKNLNLFAYTYNFGKIASLSASVEDGSERRVQDGVWARYAGQAVPDMVVRARLTPSWGTFHAAMAYHEVRDQSGNASSHGFAANAGAEYRQKWADIFGAAAGDSYGRFMINAAYARGALDYLGIPHFATDYALDVGNRLDKTNGTSFVVSYEHLWRHNFKTTAALSSYQTQMGLTSFDWKVRGIMAQVGAEYQPVPGLMVGAEVDYYRDSIKGNYFGIPANRDTANIVHGFLYVRRRV